MRSVYINEPLFSGVVYDILWKAILTRVAALPIFMPLHFLFRPYTWILIALDFAPLMEFKSTQFFSCAESAGGTL